MLTLPLISSPDLTLNESILSQAISLLESKLSSKVAQIDTGCQGLFIDCIFTKFVRLDYPNEYIRRRKYMSFALLVIYYLKAPEFTECASKAFRYFEILLNSLGLPELEEPISLASRTKTQEGGIDD